MATAAPLSYTAYTYTSGTGFITPHSTYPDTGGVELNNNATGTSAYTDAAWVGFNYVPATPGAIRVNITFPAAFNFSTLSVNYLEDPTDGVYGANNVAIKFDGGSAFTYTGFISDAGAQSRTNVINLTGRSGQTLELTFNPVVNPGHTNPWVFLGELDFDGTPVPEPTSAALMLGGAGLLLARRRGR